MANDTNVQVLSNLNFTLQDPPNVVSRGRPKTFHTQLSRKDKSLIGVEFACFREGPRPESFKKKNKSEPKNSQTRIGCKTKMSLK